MVWQAALIGCGKIGSEFADDPKITDVFTHAGAYAACPQTRLAAVCDNDPAKAASAAQRWNCTAFTDVAAMLAAVQPQIVSVCTPDATHYPVLKQVLAAPGVRAVFAEKPLALEVAEAAELVELARERVIVLALNYFRRYATGHRAMRDWLAQGGIGEVRRVVGHYTKGLRHNGSHWLDLARFWFGEIESLHLAGCADPGFAGDPPGDSSPTLAVRFASGTEGVLIGHDAAEFSLFELEAFGSRGRLRMLDSGHVFEVFECGDSPYYSGYTTLNFVRREPGRMDNALLHAVEDMVRCLELGAHPACSGEDGLAVLRLIDGVAGMAHG